MLRLVSARWHLKQVAGDDLSTLASSLLEAGVDSPSLRELAGEGSTTIRDHGPLFARALAEAGAPTLTDDEAILVLALDAARRIQAGESPYPVTDRIGGLWTSFLKNDLLNRFYGLSDSWEENPAHRQAIEHEMREYASDLLTQYGPVAS